MNGQKDLNETFGLRMMSNCFSYKVTVFHKNKWTWEKVYQLGRGSSPSSTDNSGESNAVLAEYEFVDIFPTAISAIDLSYDTSDAIEEFTVDLAYDYWQSGFVA